MNDNYWGYPNMKTKFISKTRASQMVLAVACAAVLSACGGGGGSVAQTTAFKGGTAIGAILANATVTFKCASGSGTTTSDASGNY
jgi:hypothetical protein